MKKITLITICTFLAFIGCSQNDVQKSEINGQRRMTQSDTLKNGEQNLPKYDYRDFNIKELAQLLVEEKKSGTPNDSVFTNLFIRNGMQYGEMPKEYRYLQHHFRRGFYKIYSNHYFIKIVSNVEKDDAGIYHHEIYIDMDKRQTDMLQWMIVQLRSFGMKDLESEAAKLEGKGIRFFGMPGRISIGY